MKKVKRKNRVLLFLLYISAVLSAQNIEAYYLQMPDGLIPTLIKKQRLELIEYYKAGQQDTVLNIFGKPVFVKGYDEKNHYLKIQTTSVSYLEMKVFTKSDNTPVIGVIRTICSPLCQSTVAFYDTAWVAIPVVFTLPTATSWLNKDSIPEQDSFRISKLLRNSFVSLRFDVDKSLLIATNNSTAYMTEDDKRLVLPFLKQNPIIFELSKLLEK